MSSDSTISLSGSTWLVAQLYIIILFLDEMPLSLLASYTGSLA